MEKNNATIRKAIMERTGDCLPGYPCLYPHEQAATLGFYPIADVMGDGENLHVEIFTHLGRIWHKVRKEDRIECRYSSQ